MGFRDRASGWGWASAYLTRSPKKHGMGDADGGDQAFHRGSVGRNIWDG